MFGMTHKYRPCFMDRQFSINFDSVSPLSCVSCVPASCVHIWFVSCPRLMWLLVNCVQPCLSNCLWYSLYISPVCSVWFRLVYSLLSGVPICQHCLDVVIKDYYLSLRPRLRVLVPPCCVHRDRFIMCCIIMGINSTFKVKKKKHISTLNMYRNFNMICFTVKSLFHPKLVLLEV